MKFECFNLGEHFFSEALRKGELELSRKEKSVDKAKRNSGDESVQVLGKVKFSELKYAFGAKRYGIKEWVKTHVFRQGISLSDSEKALGKKVKECTKELRQKSVELDLLMQGTYPGAVNAQDRQEKIAQVVKEWETANINLQVLTKSLKRTRLNKATGFVNKLKVETNRLDKKINRATYMLGPNAAQVQIKLLRKEFEALGLYKTLDEAMLASRSSARSRREALKVLDRAYEIKNYADMSDPDGSNEQWSAVRRDFDSMKKEFVEELERDLVKEFGKGWRKELAELKTVESPWNFKGGVRKSDDVADVRSGAEQIIGEVGGLAKDIHRSHFSVNGKAFVFLEGEREEDAKESAIGRLEQALGLSTEQMKTVASLAGQSQAVSLLRGLMESSGTDPYTLKGASFSMGISRERNGFDGDSIKITLECPCIVCQSEEDQTPLGVIGAVRVITIPVSSIEEPFDYEKLRGNASTLQAEITDSFSSFVSAVPDKKNASRPDVGSINRALEDARFRMLAFHNLPEF